MEKFTDRTPADHVQTHADQRLIAAAPELLAALQGLLAMGDKMDTVGVLPLDKALAQEAERTAIEKAVFSKSMT